MERKELQREDSRDLRKLLKCKAKNPQNITGNGILHSHREGILPVPTRQTGKSYDLQRIWKSIQKGVA